MILPGICFLDDRTESNGRVRFTLSFYRDGRRMRKIFNRLDDAKKEALFVAQRIQCGMQHVTDLKPHERDTCKATEALLEKLGIPLYAAVEDYVRARSLAGSESLSVMATEYGKMFGNIVRRATVPEVVAELLKIREQDGASDAYLGQLRTTLNRLADKFPGPILEVTGPDVDAWLRGCLKNHHWQGPTSGRSARMVSEWSSMGRFSKLCMAAIIRRPFAGRLRITVPAIFQTASDTSGAQREDRPHLGIANPCARAGPRPQDGVAAQRASGFIHQLPHCHRPECGSGRA